jgi:hypothetical protein
MLAEHSKGVRRDGGLKMGWTKQSGVSHHQISGKLLDVAKAFDHEDVIYTTYPMKSRKCFIIAPIKEAGSLERQHSDLVIRHIIGPVLNDFGYDATRGDYEPSPGIITDNIFQRLTQDPLVIAVLKGYNPNVFYELGVRHATNMPCIQLADLSEPVPLDVAAMDTIRYDITNLDVVADAREKLRMQIKLAEESPHEFRNPVTSAAQAMDLRSKGGDFGNAMASVLSGIDDMKNQIGAIQGHINLLGVGAAGPDSIGQFIARTALHHQFVHKMRDLCVQKMSKLDQFFPLGFPAGDPHPVLEEAKGDLISALETIVRVFELIVAPGTKVWACIRARQSDDHYHTVVRAGRFHLSRADKSKPMHKDNSVTVRRLKESFSSGRCVIITGSGRGPEMWESQENDTFGEDKSVLMSAVMAKSWVKNAWAHKKMMMILAICADQENAFGERHIPLMQCFTDVFSLMINVLLRSAADEWSIS